MRHQYNFISVLLASSLLAACSSEGDEPGATPGGPRPAAFSAQIGKTASRAAGTQWVAGDAIGISGVSVAKTYANVPFATVSGDGNFTPTGDDIFYNDAADVTFTTYYPYAADLGADGIITASVSDQSNQSEFDFLWAQAVGSYASPDVHFNFAHRMAQLNIAFTNGNDVDLSDLTFSIDGLVLDGTFDTATGEAKIVGNGTAASLTAALTADSKTSLIVFPQTVDNLTVTANAEGQTFECNMALGELKAGCSYRVNITVKKTGMTVTGCTITPWGDGGNVDGEANIRIAKVGDYYYSDGTFSTNYDASRNVIGIIFYVGHHPKDGSDYSTSGIGEKQCHGYVMALSGAHNFGVTWFNFNDSGEYISGISTDTGDWNGYANQKAIERFITLYHAISLSNFEAAYKCSIYGTSASGNYAQFRAPEKSSGWFLPSVGQFVGFHKANSETGNLLNNKITAVESVSNRVGNLRYADSWCSTMSSNSSAYHVFFPEADSGDVSIETIKITDTTYVLPMLAF